MDSTHSTDQIKIETQNVIQKVNKKILDMRKKLLVHGDIEPGRLLLIKDINNKVDCSTIKSKSYIMVDFTACKIRLPSEYDNDKCFDDEAITQIKQLIKDGRSICLEYIPATKYSLDKYLLRESEIKPADELNPIKMILAV